MRKPTITDEELWIYLNSLVDHFNRLEMKTTVRQCLDALKLRIPNFKVDYNRLATMLRAVKKSREEVKPDIEKKYWLAVGGDHWE